MVGPLLLRMPVPQIGNTGFLEQMPFIVRDADDEEGSSEFWEQPRRNEEGEEPFVRPRQPR